MPLTYTIDDGQAAAVMKPLIRLFHGDLEQAGVTVEVPDQPTMELRPTDLEFKYKNAYPEAPIPEAYERLIAEALAGDASLFMRADEIEKAWAIMDPFIKAIEEPDGVPMARAWLAMLLFFDVVFVTLALWTFEPVMTE